MILLQGATSGVTFIHADSVVMLDRLPAGVADALLTTERPIGKLLAERRTETFREIVGAWAECHEPIAAHFGLTAHDPLLARTYRIVARGRPWPGSPRRSPRSSRWPCGSGPRSPGTRGPGPSSPPASSTGWVSRGPRRDAGAPDRRRRMTGARPGAPVAIVTGGGRGIGRAVALALAADGHAVCVHDTGVTLNGHQPGPGPARSVVEEIARAGGSAWASTNEARTRAGAAEVVAEAERRVGRPPNVLVHAAGTLRDAMVHKATDDDWAEVLGSHLSVGVELTRVLAPTMRASSWGRIVYVGGAAGLVGSIGQAAYCVAKAGLFGLTRAVALEMAGRDVCVNYLAPFAFTRMTESIPLPPSGSGSTCGALR